MRYLLIIQIIQMNLLMVTMFIPMWKSEFFTNLCAVIQLTHPLILLYTSGGYSPMTDSVNQMMQVILQTPNPTVGINKQPWWMKIKVTITVYHLILHIYNTNGSTTWCTRWSNYIWRVFKKKLHIDLNSGPWIWSHWWSSTWKGTSTWDCSCISSQ